MGGVALMVISVGGAASFFGWCLWKLLSTPSTSRHIHSQADILPPDREDRLR